MFIDVIQIQAFWSAGFHKDTEQNTTSHTACCDPASRVTILGNLVSLGANLIYLCLIKHIAGLH